MEGEEFPPSHMERDNGLEADQCVQKRSPVSFTFRIRAPYSFTATTLTDAQLISMR